MKVEVGTSGDKGRGVFAIQDIGACEVVASVRFTREITSEAPLAEGEQYEHQIYLPDGSVHLVAEPMCFTNHSCDPNSYIYSVNRRYFVVAKRRIPSGEGITVDYELTAVDGDTWECKCGSESCRGLHRWDFFSLPTDFVLESLPYLDPWFVSVHQERIEMILMRSLEGER